MTPPAASGPAATGDAVGRDPAATGDGGDPAPAACAAALATLPGIGPVALTRLLSEAGGDPAVAWAGVRDGRTTRPVGRAANGRPSWREAACRLPVDRWWAACEAAGVGVTWLGAPGYPPALSGDPLPPPVLFWRGDLAALDARRVALIGTRRCTPDGAATAFELGRDLAAAGVCVISGLALGIDGAAHRGALAAGAGRNAGTGRTVGVAASGADRPYPARHGALWEAVVTGGAVVSETPPGRPAQAWRFPARNRIIAGLAEVVVVVESHAAGGSLLTVDAALERGVEVCAVPGPVRSPASAGTNQLLRDGPAPVRDAGDILDALGDFRPRSAQLTPPGKPGRTGTRPAQHAGAAPPAGPGAPPDPAGLPPGAYGDQSGKPAPAPELRAVLESVGWRPTSFNAVVGASAQGVGTVAAALDQLLRHGLVVEERGWWQRRR